MPDTHRIPVTPEQARKIFEVAGAGRSEIGRCSVLFSIMGCEMFGHKMEIAMRGRRAWLCESIGADEHRICGLCPARARKYLEAMRGGHNDG